MAARWVREQRPFTGLVISANEIYDRITLETITEWFERRAQDEHPFAHPICYVFGRRE